MKFLDSSLTMEWIAKRRIELLGRNFLAFDENPRTIRIETPASLQEAPIFANALFRTMTELAPCDEVVIWIKETHIWADRWSDIGVAQMNLMSHPAGLSRFPAGFTSLLLGSDEELSAVAFSVMPMIYGWDAYLVPSHGDSFVFITHEPYVEIGFRDPAAEPLLLESLREWNPCSSVSSQE